MKRTWGLAVLAACCAGCVEQRYVICSDPPGAAVYRNGSLIGYTPVDDTFVYYGKYHFTLVKDGYETLQVDQEVEEPFYEFPGVDFVSEVLYPFKLRDVHRFSYQLREAVLPGKSEIINRGEQLRGQGKVLLQQQNATAPAAPPGPSPPPLGAPLPVPDAAPGNP